MRLRKYNMIMYATYCLCTRCSVEIHGGLVRFLTAVALGSAARRAVDQRVTLVGHQPGRLVHVQRVEIPYAMVRPGSRSPR